MRVRLNMLIVVSVLAACGKTATEAPLETTDATSSSTDASAPDARVVVKGTGDGGCYDKELCLFCRDERKWRCQGVLAEQCTDAEAGLPCDLDGGLKRSCFRCHPDGTGELFDCANRVWLGPGHFACEP